MFSQKFKVLRTMVSASLTFFHCFLFFIWTRWTSDSSENCLHFAAFQAWAWYFLHSLWVPCLYQSCLLVLEGSSRMPPASQNLLDLNSKWPLLPLDHVCLFIYLMAAVRVIWELFFDHIVKVGKAKMLPVTISL